ncbi:hypothetical protein B0T18DRAFT_135486 [Schizothecium vesticola]|uniref:Uncharacterized protein n=1 Tax=Schizothecium vesticola TaxID=314040 RepID=A0AA40K4J6_9PEZI|nr:hypothetical protein B0T18DRAFT_135486 [Schizothecium vesticola]
MDTQHVEFTRANTPMTDMPANDDPPTTRVIPFVRPEHPIIISTITPREGHAILRQVINNDTATLTRLLNDLAARDKTIPGKILVQARDRLGRNALHVALLLDDKETLSTHVPLVPARSKNPPPNTGNRHALLPPAQLHPPRRLPLAQARLPQPSHAPRPRRRQPHPIRLPPGQVVPGRAHAHGGRRGAAGRAQ